MEVKERHIFELHFEFIEKKMLNLYLINRENLPRQV